MTGLRAAVAGAFMLAASTPLLAQSSPQLRVLGEVRVRAEAERPATVDTSDLWTLLRTRAALEASLSPEALVFVQLQDARTFGEEQSTTDGSADRIDLHQAYLQYGRRAGDLQWGVRAGRQEVSIGNERLVGAVAWSNTGRSFDGAVAAIGRSAAPGVQPWRVAAVAATLQERGRRTTAAAAERSDDVLLGAWGESGIGEAWLLHDRLARQRFWRDVRRTTFGARVAAPPGRLNAWAEASLQLGGQEFTNVAPVSQDIRAWMAGARVAFQTDAGPLRRIGAGLDILSGDEDPADDEYSAFNTLYAANHRFYGLIDQFLDPAARTQDRGLVDGMVSATLGAGEVAVDVEAHVFRTQQARAADGSRDLGWELDFTLPVQLGVGQMLHVGYSLYRNGGAAPAVGLGEEGRVWHWGYVSATFAFGGRPAPLP